MIWTISTGQRFDDCDWNVIKTETNQRLTTTLGNYDSLRIVYQNFPKIREEIAIMELELVSHHFHMGLSHFLKNF